MNLKQLHTHIKQTCTDVEARIILEDIARIEWSDLITASEQEMPAPVIETIQTILNERAGGKPLSKILGYKEFYGRNFKTNEHTLDPRPETEILIEKSLTFLKGTPNPKILDLGTGTGCIPITLLSERPDATATAVDISKDALAVARHNKETHAQQDRLTCIQSNWFESVEGQFDVITSNPPYIDSNAIPNLAPEVKNHDPILALDGGKNGLEPYEIIFSNIKNHLNPQGRAFFEIGYDQCGYIARLAEKYRIRVEATHLDLAGIPRVVEISCGDK